ncbi:MAG: (d)CMP kinase [Planctomycetota bacterium]|nr:(d)CMP kinase [Planctomycetota bacterium]
MANASGKPIIITIDGPAGTGKSSVAHRLAERLGLEFLDTGAMYRSAAIIALDEEIPPTDGESLAKALGKVTLRFDWETDPPRMYIDDRCVSRRIRDLDVNEIVSQIAAQASVREMLVTQQRAIARRHPRLVTEGRDQGSVVFPDATVQFYLDASVEVRAQRRIDQLKRAGKVFDEQLVKLDIEARDHHDSNRDLAPLIKPDSAIVVDTSDQGLMEVVDELTRLVQQQVPDLVLDA